MSFFKRFLMVFSPKAKVEEPKKEEPVAEKTTGTILLFEYMDTPKFDLDHIDDITHKLNAYFHDCGKSFYKFGHNDGVKGISNNILVHAKTQASIVKRSTLAQLRGMQAEIGKIIEAKEKLEQSKSFERKEQINYLEFLNSHYRFDSRLYAPKMAWFYLFIGIAMIFSDFPLTYDLMQNGLLGNSNLTWMVWLLTIGLAFIPMYFKYYFDIYLNQEDGNEQLKFSSIYHTFRRNLFNQKSLQDEYIDRNNSLKNNSESDLKKSIPISLAMAWILKFIFRTMVLLSCIYFLYTVASYRELSMDMQKAKSEVNELKNSWANSYDTNVSATDSVSNKSNATLDEIRNDFKPVARKTFLFMTILLPLIGGLMLSIGIKILQNIRNKEHGIKDLAALDDELKVISEDVATLKNKHTRLDFLCSLWSDEEEAAFQNELQEFLISNYQSGYSQGYVRPTSQDGNSALSLLERVEKAFGQMSQRKIYTKLNSL